MKQVVIENPIINSPLEEPRRHFRFSEEGITNEIVGHRRISSYFIPVAAQYADFDTTQPTYRTRPDKSHISHAACDTDAWEQKLAQSLEDMPEVFAYVKNQNLGFTIPYTLNGEEHNYYPDFIVRMDDSHGPADLLNLILECTGQKRRTRKPKSRPHRRFGFPPSTATANLAAGASLRLVTRGTRKVLSRPR